MDVGRFSLLNRVSLKAVCIGLAFGRDPKDGLDFQTVAGLWICTRLSFLQWRLGWCWERLHLGHSLSGGFKGSSAWFCGETLVGSM